MKLIKVYILLYSLLFLMNSAYGQDIIGDEPILFTPKTSKPLNISNRIPAEGSLSSLYSNFTLSGQTDSRLSDGELAVVIVEFSTSSPMMTGGRPNLTSLRSMVRGSKNSFMQKLDLSSESRIRREYDYLPFMSFIVNRNDIVQLTSMSEVVRITENFIYEPTLANTFFRVGADYTDSLGVNGNGCTIAVFDTGIDPNHVMFEDKVIASTCFNTTADDLVPFGIDTGFSESNCPDGSDAQISLTDGFAGVTCDIDGCFHGNFVSAIAAGGIGRIASTEFTGIASGSDLISMNVLSKVHSPEFCGSPEPCAVGFCDDLLEGMDWVLDNYLDYNIYAINVSLGGGQSFGPCDDDPLFIPISLLRDLGIATVVASGNDGFDDSVSFPACISSAISVGSVGFSTISSFSNHGPDLVDLLAPGEFIISAYGVQGDESIYLLGSGTSFAAPHVTAAFAMFKAEYPTATVDEIESILMQTGDPIEDTVRGHMGSLLRLDTALDEFISRFSVVAPEVIPTMGEWGLMCLALCFLVVGVIVLRQSTYIVEV